MRILCCIIGRQARPSDSLHHFQCWDAHRSVSYAYISVLIVSVLIRETLTMVCSFLDVDPDHSAVPDDGQQGRSEGDDRDDLHLLLLLRHCVHAYARRVHPGDPSIQRPSQRLRGYGKRLQS